MKVLVRSIGLQKENHDDSFDFDSMRCDRRLKLHREHFHTVDLGVPEGKLDRDVLPQLVCCTGGKTMDIVASEEVIYLIGGVYYREHRRHIKALKPPPEKENLFYKGGSKIKLHGMESWDNEVETPNENLLFPCCASLLGKIYSFGFCNFKPEVYDPSVGKWEEFNLLYLPPELFHCGGASIPAVPDPANSRILVHCRDGITLEDPSLFAFYPATSEWKLLTSICWADTATVAEDVIYFPDFDIRIDDSPSPPIVAAFDLLTDKWSNIVWKKESINVLKDFIFHLRRRYCEFKLFTLKDGSICITSISYEYLSYDETKQQSTINLCFLNFTVERDPNSAKDLILTPLKVQTIVLDSTSSVLNIIPI